MRRFYVGRNNSYGTGSNCLREGRSWDNVSLSWLNAVPILATMRPEVCLSGQQSKRISTGPGKEKMPLLQTRRSFISIVALWSVCLMLLLSQVSTSHALNYGAGAKLPEGMLLNLYPNYYHAETRTDKNGNAAIYNLGLHRYGMAVGASYYTGNWLFNTVIPVGNLELQSRRSDKGGIGDIQLRAGYFLPIDSVTILPLLFIKTPSGSYDRNHPANYGDGQLDMAAEVYFRKLIGSLSLDALLKYTVRFRNQDSDITPGNEFLLETLATWKIVDSLWAGPAVNFNIGGDNKRNGADIPDSGLLKLAVGGEIYYRGFSRAKLSLAAYQDVVTRNTTEGLMLMGRIAIPF